MQHPLISMQTLCALFGKSRQAWYDGQKQRENNTFQHELLLNEVRRIRLRLPATGAEKLHAMTADWCQAHGIKIGRNQFAKLLRESHLLVRRRRTRVSTTYSHHHFYKYPNLVVGLRATRPNLLWVSDITYVPLVRGFCYLSLVTDAYSRKIVGWALHPTLALVGPITALRMALAERGSRTSESLIHHSDRGVQYCAYEYTSLLLTNRISISMATQGETNENPVAERINRTIKEELLQSRSFVNYQEAKEAIEEAIEAYNQLRPHASCDYLTPCQAHQRAGELPRRWRRSNRYRQRKVQLQALDNLS